jgi:XTP/dITP diphosphohydrolase
MTMKPVYFCSTNPEKHADVAHVFAGSPSPPRRLVPRELVEPLSSDLEVVVRAKAMAAYRKALVPLFVEHGALHVDHLNGLPGPMVKIFWEKLGDRLGSLLPPAAALRRAHQIQKVCYCDGRTLRVYTGRVEGTLADAPRGTGGLHWEPIFVPDGQTQTLGEMSRAQRLAESASAAAFAALRADLGI